MKELYGSWVKEMVECIEDVDQPLSLKTSGKLMELSHTDGKLHVQYDERLVKLIREVM